MIALKLKELLKNTTFIDIATCDYEGRPNVVPKFMLKLEGDCIYLVDYVVGRTYKNLKINHRVSIPAMDFDTLIGYQLNGEGEIIEDGQEYNKLLKQIGAKKVKLSVDRIVEAVKKSKIHNNFEISISERVVILKIKVAEVVALGPTGELKREKI